MTTAEFLIANREEIISDIKYFMEDNNIVYLTLSEVMIIFKSKIEEKGTDKWGVANQATIIEMKEIEKQRWLVAQYEIDTFRAKARGSKWSK